MGVVFFPSFKARASRIRVGKCEGPSSKNLGDFYGGGWWLRRESWRCLGTGIGTGRIGIGVGTGVGRIGIGIGIGIGIEEVHEGFGLVESMLCEGFGKENKVGLLVCDPEQG